MNATPPKMTPEQIVTACVRLKKAADRVIDCQLRLLEAKSKQSAGPPDCDQEAAAVEAAQEAYDIAKDVLAAAQAALIACQSGS